MKGKAFYFLGLISIVMLLASCQQQQTNYRIGYVNLRAVYASQASLQQADSLKNQQLQQLDNYVANIDRSLKMSKLTKEEIAQQAKLYTDTINSFKQAVDNRNMSVWNTKNIEIQTLIDSIGASQKFEYVLSTNNSTILFVKDSTNNITELIIEALKK